jgi:hypothetical protein
VFDIALLGPTGDVVTSTFAIGENDEGAQLRIVGYRFASGDYRLRVSYVGSGEFERVLHVP